MNAAEPVSLSSAPAKFNPELSITDNATAQPTRTLTAIEVVGLFRTGDHRPLVAEIQAKFARIWGPKRSLQAAKDAVATDKKKLPGIMASGIFRARGDKHLATYSQMLCLDIDELAPDRVRIVYKQLLSEPQWIWPQGDIRVRGFL